MLQGVYFIFMFYFCRQSLAVLEDTSTALDKVDWIRLFIDSSTVFLSYRPPLNVERIQCDTDVSHQVLVCTVDRVDFCKLAVIEKSSPDIGQSGLNYTVFIDSSTVLLSYRPPL
jgi:hypothetical protein